MTKPTDNAVTQTNKQINNEIRRHHRKLRNELTIAQQQQASNALPRQLSNLLNRLNNSSKPRDKKLYQMIDHATHIAFYFADDGEINPIELINAFWSKAVSIYLPVINDQNPIQPLTFEAFHPDSSLKNNQFGIPEPSEQISKQIAEKRSNHEIPVEQLDIIFIPLVAFNQNGYRLGRGGGYYDRTLSKLNNQDLNKQEIEDKQTILIGLAHDNQQNEQFQMNAFDIPLNFILTPTRFITRGSEND